MADHALSNPAPPLTVVLLENVPSARRGGKELSLLDVSRGLHQRGHTLHLLHFSDGDLLPAYGHICQRVTPLAQPRFVPRQAVGSLGRLVGQARAVARQVRPTAQGPGVIYLDQDRGCVAAAVLGLVLGWPVVFHLRQPVFTQLPLQERWAFGQVRRFIAVSEQTRQDWSALGLPPAKITVVHNGLDPQRFAPAPPPTSGPLCPSPGVPVIAYLGRLDPEKGIDTLIRAFAQVVARAPAAHPPELWLGGQPVCHPSAAAKAAYLQALKDLADGLGVGARVRWLGHVADPPALYRASTVTVLPSRNSEPFGKTVIESLACGVPVVASRVGGIPEILTGDLAPWLVPPNQDTALAEALLALLPWRTQQPALAERCRQHVLDHFTLAHTIAQVEGVLHQVARS